MAGTFYCVSLDASQTQSASFPTDQLTFAWSDLFGGTGTLPTYAFTVTDTQLNGATSTVVTLAVTDPNSQETVRQIPVSLV